MAMTMDLFRHEADAVDFEEGQVIFREGDRADVMYVLLDGQVELTIRGKRLETLGPGEALGEMALIEQEPRIATAIAATRCRLARISEKRFMFMVQQTPYFALQIMKTMAGRLRKMDARV